MTEPFLVFTVLRDKYVEKLLEINRKILTDAKVVDSIAIYNRWVQYGGYRCDPSRYICKQYKTNVNKWTCQCPIGEFGTTVEEVKNGCEFKDGGTYTSTSMTPFSCPDVSPIPALPAPYPTEIICGIYKVEKLKHPPAKDNVLTIESGLHYNNIKCPGTQRCLLKEFDAECSQENSDKLTEWIKEKNVKYNNFVKDRRPGWPPCTCSSNPPKPFPASDPRNIEMDKILLSLPQAEYGSSCDRSGKYRNT